MIIRLLQEKLLTNEPCNLIIESFLDHKLSIKTLLDEGGYFLALFGTFEKN